jgi:ubiquitin-protein ligase
MIKEGFYEKAIFRFIIIFSDKFPKELPSIKFTNKIYHPLISENGLLDLPTLFPDWKYEIGRQLLDILTKMRTIFTDNQYFEMESSLNPEAARLFKENPEAFLEKTLECANKGKEDDCPYKFKKIETLPEEVKTILENNEV